MRGRFGSLTLLCLCLALWIPTTANAVATSPWSAAHRSAADAFLRNSVTRGDTPAVVAMVVDRSSTLYVGAFGQQNGAEHHVVTANTLFRLASMTKPVTSLAAMMLIEQGKIGLDDPATKYLPELAKFRVMTAWHQSDGSYDWRPPKRPITIRDLLTQTSGISYSFTDTRLAKLDGPGVNDVDLPLLHDPGTKFTYGPNTAIVGRIIEKVSGQTLDEYFRVHIFEPLGMHDTFFVVPADKVHRVITIQARGANGALTEQPNPAAIKSQVRGDGGLFSTAADYATFMQVFLNGGRHGGMSLVSERTLGMMTSNQIGGLRISQQPTADATLALPFPIGAGKDTFGFGLQIEGAPRVPGLRSIGSLSWGGIFNTHFWIDPHRSIAAVVLMQTLPYYDARAMKVLRGFERIVYSERTASSGSMRVTRRAGR
jgi:CubicO group peptidase (beta-lactamase class C family)